MGSDAGTHPSLQLQPPRVYQRVPVLKRVLRNPPLLTPGCRDAPSEHHLQVLQVPTAATSSLATEAVVEIVPALGHPGTCCVTDIVRSYQLFTLTAVPRGLQAPTPSWLLHNEN